MYNEMVHRCEDETTGVQESLERLQETIADKTAEVNLLAERVERFKAQYQEDREVSSTKIICRW